MPSLTSFPGSPSIGQKYAIGNVQWKYNGYAWDKEFHGHTGEQLVNSISGKTGDIDLCYPGLTISGQTLCIDNTARIHVAGISSDGGITFGGRLETDGDVILSSNDGFGRIGIQSSSGNPSFMSLNTVIGATANEPVIRFEAEHKLILGDPEGANDGTNLVIEDRQQKFEFRLDGAGFDSGNPLVKIDSTGVSAGVTLSTGSDLVIAGDGDLIFDGSDAARIFQNGQEVFYIDNVNGVRIPIYSLGINQIFAHNNDQDTRMQFKTNQIQLEAGGNVFLEGDVTGVSASHIRGITQLTFADGTTQESASRAGLKYRIQTDEIGAAATSGGVVFTSNVNVGQGSIFDLIGIHDTDANGNDIGPILDSIATDGGFIQILKDDGSELAAIQLPGDGSSVFSSDVLTITASLGVLVDTTPQTNDTIYVNAIPFNSSVSQIGGDNNYN